MKKNLVSPFLLFYNDILTNMSFKIEISDDDLMLSDTTSLLWKVSVQLSEHITKLQARATGRTCVFGDFRGTVVRVDNHNVTLVNADKVEKTFPLNATRLRQITAAVTTRK